MRVQSRRRRRRRGKVKSVFNDTTAVSVGAAVVLGLAAVAVASRRPSLVLRVLFLGV